MGLAMINLYKFHENRGRDMPMWRIHTCIPKFGIIFSFLGPVMPPCTDGVKSGEDEWTVQSSTPNFTPIGATCRPCGAKNLKIAL